MFEGGKPSRKAISAGPTLRRSTYPLLSSLPPDVEESFKAFRAPRDTLAG
jgi:hypothetical protein